MPVDFEQDERIAFVRDFVHAFATDTLRPLAREADEKGKLPDETIKQLAGFAGNRASVSAARSTFPETSTLANA